MPVLVIIAIISLLLGIVFLGNQDTLKKLSEAMNRVIISEKDPSSKYSKALGIFLILFAGALFLIAIKFK